MNAHKIPSLLACLVLSFPSILAAQEVASSLAPRVVLETSEGTIVLELDAVRAPLTTENFLRYVRSGAYDGVQFHRIVPNFVIQAGGFDATFKPIEVGPPLVNESGNGLGNVRGSLGMARGDSPHSATSQFYVNIKDNLGLNPLPSRWGYAVFGKVAEGMEIVDRIAYVATGERYGFTDVPLKPILIQRASVAGEEVTEPGSQ